MSQSGNLVKKIERRVLADLIPFPTQEQTFSACTAADDDNFREDIRSNGLRDLLHVIPENSAGLEPDTLLFGYRRCRALQEIGHTEYDVWVRYDLATASFAELEQLFLADNFQRRQLSKLERARVALRLFEIEKSREQGELDEQEESEARERVGKAIGMSGRNVQRYINIVQAPLSVQNAFENGQIKLVEAGRLACLPPGMLTEVDQLLQSGVCPSKVLKQYPSLRSRAGKRPREVKIKKFKQSVVDLSRALSDADNLLTREVLPESNLESITNLRDGLSTLIAKLQPPKPHKRPMPGVRYVGRDRPRTA